MAGQRSLGREDRTLVGTAALLLIGLALFAGFFPQVLGALVAGIAGWLGLVTGVRGLIQSRRARKEEQRLREVYERLDRQVQ